MNSITAQEWRNKSYEGTLCGVLGCFDNDKLSQCTYCSLSYCESHIVMHETICVDVKEDHKREIESLRERDQGHINHVPDERREELREKIWLELQSKYGLIDYDEMYITGSWANGEAIYGMSDLDLVIVVNSSDVTNEIRGSRKYFKNEFSPGECDDDPWLFIDLWIEYGPPEDRVIL